jgi:LEA14-like dessication related protein
MMARFVQLESGSKEDAVLPVAALKTKYAPAILRVIGVALILALPGCVYTKLLTTHLEKPTFTYQGVEMIEASQSKAIVTFLLTAHNPNDAGLRNVTCSYELYVEEKKFLTGKDIPLELAPKGDTEIKIPATIAYTDLAPVLRSVVRRILSGQKTIPVTIDAVLSGRPALYGEPGGKEYPLSFEQRVVKTAEIPLQQERRNKVPEAPR